MVGIRQGRSRHLRRDERAWLFVSCSHLWQCTLMASLSCCPTGRPGHWRDDSIFQSHYTDTEQFSPCPILLIACVRLCDDNYTFVCHWFDLARIWVGRNVAQVVEHSAVKVWILMHGRSILHDGSICNLDNWFTKGCGMCCPVCGKVRIKRSLAAYRKE